MKAFTSMLEFAQLIDSVQFQLKALEIGIVLEGFNLFGKEFTLRLFRKVNTGHEQDKDKGT